MGRHADPTAPARRPAPVVLIAAGIVAVLLAGGLVWWIAGSGEECETRQIVGVTVAPELGDVAGKLLADPIVLDDGLCAVPDVTAQEPLQTVGDLGALDADALPGVWVPDSSLWAGRAGEAPLEGAGSMGSSPVVLATSRAVGDALGWTAQVPSWGQALATDRPLAVPDLASSAEGLSALAAVRSSLGGGEDADNAVVEAVLAAARATPITPADALAAGAAGADDAPVVPVSEQEVFRINQGTENPSLIAVYPAEGSPFLDYPVLRVGERSGTERAAADAVVRTLTSDRALTLVQEAGFRGSDGAPPPGAGGQTGIQEAAPATLTLDPAEVQGLFARLSSLAKPSRLLAVFDVSTSMRAPVGDGTRATLARDAAKSALALFPDNAAIGLWAFARRLGSDTDWVELVPTRTLAADAGGRPQRDVLTEQLDSIPDRLSPGGTGLYDTTLAAVRAARANFDPTAVTSVVIVTDGKDEDEDTIGLDALVQALSAEVDPSRPVKVIGIALGPDADMGALEQIAAATGGDAYSAVDENDLQTVLFDALRQRS
ncbi:substrate-binding domain-containing protein [Blastococcus sp. CT_GayMR16]|uniref:substrate-binding domain-containing protein n=1 Tax=Blastococcus sp. CT_GayMR16 TaxID=2559607 RepID=UPI0010730F2A|nr:substrate-binding domain-containing protein [Blastococcus sp. CT_GayMR16]TFV90442.1 VWA domain-containing protein [Blastococcus sp. CT_GayMR16]